MSFTPEEYARTFMKLYSMNVVEGVFISSAVCGSADDTTEEMLEAIRLLRFKYNFQGYIHFKCLPGVGQYLLKEAISLSDQYHPTKTKYSIIPLFQDSIIMKKLKTK